MFCVVLRSPYRSALLCADTRLVTDTPQRALDQSLGELLYPVALQPVFFFQAEDGIRDRNVTGVQTCALPISCVRLRRRSERFGSAAQTDARAKPARPEGGTRSEERRVGKECRYRWWPYH